MGLRSTGACNEAAIPAGRRSSCQSAQFPTVWLGMVKTEEARSNVCGSMAESGEALQHLHKLL